MGWTPAHRLTCKSTRLIEVNTDWTLNPQPPRPMASRCRRTEYVIQKVWLHEHT